MSSAAKNEHRLPVFGVSLDAIMSRSTQKQIPTFVKELILCLKNHLSVEGIFVNMPQPDLVYEAKKLVDFYEKDDYDFEKFDPHVVAALLKMYFRELPDPLFTSRLYIQFINSEGSISVLRDLVHKELPPHHAKLAEVLCLFLRLVLDYSAVNKVSLDELAVMFGPLLIRTQTETIDTMADTKKRTRVFKQLIQNADKIFPKIPAKRTLVRVQETPELIGQKQKLVTIKSSLKASVQALSKQLVTIHADLDTASNMEELLEITRTLKALKENFVNYTKNKTAAQEERAPLSARRYLPGSICKSAVESGHTSLQGKRASMEDRITMYDDLNETSDGLSKNVNRALYAVYDGHSGSEASEIASQRLYRDIVTQEAFESGDILEAIKLGVEKTDLFILDNVPEAGSTMVMAILIGEELYVANLGDSEAVIAKRSDSHASNYEALCVTHKHKPDNPDEKDRITAAGAMVFRHRIYGKLAVARALGDAEYKMPKVKADYVSRDPYLQKLQLTDEYEFMIMACDGLWDKMTHQEAVDFVAERMTGGHNAQEISSLLANKALDLGSMDNVTVIIVFLKWKAPSA